jgi:hypothetical protein
MFSWTMGGALPRTAIPSPLWVLRLFLMWFDRGMYHRIVDLRVFASQGDVLPFEVDILGVRPGIHNHYVPILCGVNG